MATWVEAITGPVDSDPIAGVTVGDADVVNSEVFAVVIADGEASVLSLVAVVVGGNVCAANCHFEFTVVWESFTRW